MDVANGRASSGLRAPIAASASPGARRHEGVLWAEATLAAAFFAALCVVVLSVAPQPAEPDDGAYRASIVAITEGHLLTLSDAQARALAATLDDNPAAPPNQWVEVSPGRYLSEKDPGYPFLAAPFEKLGIIRWAPLFAGAVACWGLFLGARRWLGPFGGSAAVGLYCSSGAAMAFAWRDYMPTFTDASLVAAGSGLLLWALLAVDAGTRRRAWMSLAGFVALELATFVRYTDIVVLGCALLAAMVVWRRSGAVPFSTLCLWLSSAAVLGVGVSAFDTLVYGGPLRSGYAPGEVRFSLRALAPNLTHLPGHLLEAMPVLALGVAAMVWIVVRRFTLRQPRVDDAAGARRDLWVGLALLSGWAVLWGLYATYTWTTDPTSLTVQVVRFYVPALGSIALLGAWLVTRIPGHLWLRAAVSTAGVAALFAQGVSAFHAMYAAFGVPL